MIMKEGRKMQQKTNHNDYEIWTFFVVMIVKHGGKLLMML